MTEVALFSSATVVSNSINDRHAVIWRTYIVSFYNTADDYVSKNVESFLTFDDYCEAFSAAYFWCESEVTGV